MCHVCLSIQYFSIYVPHSNLILSKVFQSGFHSFFLFSVFWFIGVSYHDHIELVYILSGFGLYINHIHI